MTDPRENQGQPHGGSSPYDGTGQGNPTSAYPAGGYPAPGNPPQGGYPGQYQGQYQYQGQGPAGYGPGGAPNHPGYGNQAPFGQPAAAKPGAGSKLIAFLTRDKVALVAGALTLLSGILLLIAPRLAWLVDRSFDLVEGTMSVSATGTIDLSSSAQRTLSDSDALELGFVEMTFKLLLEPLAGMLSLSGLLVIIGGLLMLTTARQLGAVFAALGVVPQLFVLAIGILVVAIYAEDSPPASTTATSTSTSGTDFSPGAGAILTLVTYVVIIACAMVAAVRQGERPRSAPSATPGYGDPAGYGGPAGYGDAAGNSGADTQAGDVRNPGADPSGGGETTPDVGQRPL